MSHPFSIALTDVNRDVFSYGIIFLEPVESIVFHPKMKNRKMDHVDTRIPTNAPNNRIVQRNKIIKNVFSFYNEGMVTT